MRKLILPALLCFLAAYTFAQAPSQNSLLWQITGNGLKKPSYLFGTMHVSQKVAFHLGETWFRCIDSVDVIALEQTPDTWLKDILESDAGVKSYNNPYRTYSGKSQNTEKDRYIIANDRSKLIAGILKEDPAIINNIMYRYSPSQGDFEEDSWLDMYLHQTAIKLGKKSTGLETFAESMLSLKKAAMPDEQDEKNYDYSFSRESQIQPAYRNGNITLIDSLSRKANTKNQQKYIIVERNERFVTRMDSMMKNVSLFTGVGAAHLGGDNGMINLLRKLGYTLTPVNMGERDAERRNKLDSTIFDVPFTKYVSADSVISFNVPSEMYEFYSMGLAKNEIATELVNGAFYSLSRIKTYSALVDSTPAVTWKMVDSLLYDNVPGKMLEQKETTVGGFKAFDITARLRKGNIIRIRIIQLPEELIILKVSAPEDKALGFLGSRFLESVAINITPVTSWQRFTLPDTSMSVLLPGKPVFYGLSRLTNRSLKNDFFVHDSKTGCDYLAININMPVPAYFEEDTFELSRMAYLFSQANSYTEKKRKFVDFKGRKALKVQLKINEHRNAEALIIMQNLDYYVFAVYYNKSAPDAGKFFESIELALPEFTNYYPLTDTLFYFTTQTVKKPLPNAYESSYKGTYSKTKPTKLDKDKTISKSETLTDDFEKEGIRVTLFKYCKYTRFKDEEEFLKTARYYVTSFDDFVIKDEKITRNSDGLQMDFSLVDTNTTKIKLCRILLKNSAKYTITTFIDPLLGPSKFVKKFYAEFKPIDSLTGGNLFIDKSDLFFADLQSTDTLYVNFARDNVLRIKIPTNKKAQLIEVFSHLPKMNDYVEFKAHLYGLFETMPDRDVIDFLKSEYSKAGDTADYQVAILETLGNMKTPDAIAAYRQLITTEPPISEDADGLLIQLADSTELAAKLYPALFELLNYDEYKEDVYHLLSKCVADSSISPEVYKDKLNAILSNARVQLKRIQSQEDEGDKDYERYRYENRLDDYNYLLLPYIKQESVKAHFDKVLLADNKDIQIDLLECLLKMKSEVPAPTISKLAADIKYRLKVYNLLKRNKMESLFPKAQATTGLFIQSLLKSSYSNLNSDSVFFLQKQKIDWKGKKGYVYFYKYKNKEAKGDRFNVTAVGVIPEDTTRIITEFDFYSGQYAALNKDDKLEKQLQELLYNTLLKYRENNYFDLAKVDVKEEEYKQRFASYYSYK